jgi:hypothetical protein
MPASRHDPLVGRPPRCRRRTLHPAHRQIRPNDVFSGTRVNQWPRPGLPHGRRQHRTEMPPARVRTDLEKVRNGLMSQSRCSPDAQPGMSCSGTARIHPSRSSPCLSQPGADRRQMSGCDAGTHQVISDAAVLRVEMGERVDNHGGRRVVAEREVGGDRLDWRAGDV